MAEAAPKLVQNFDDIRFGRDWIRYTAAEETISMLERLLSMPQSHRMPNLVIAGPTNNGKTAILDRFYQSHQPVLHLNDEPSVVPVLMLQMPDVPDVSAVYNEILTGLLVPFRATVPLDQRRRLALLRLEMVQVKMLIFDEFHHIAATTPTRQRQMLQMVKYIGNELRIPIVAAGTREAFNSLRSDPQLANRFRPAFLPRWQMDQEYVNLLATFAILLPGTLGSRLTGERLSRMILTVSGGTIGDIAELIATAGEYALLHGKGAIDSDAIESCSFIPNDKKNRAPELD